MNSFSLWSLTWKKRSQEERPSGTDPLMSAKNKWRRQGSQSSNLSHSPGQCLKRNKSCTQSRAPYRGNRSKYLSFRQSHDWNWWYPETLEPQITWLPTVLPFSQKSTKKLQPKERQEGDWLHASGGQREQGLRLTTKKRGHKPSKR